MAIGVYTLETNYCDFCGQVCSKDRLYMICHGVSPSFMDWKEVVCEDCGSGSSYGEFRSFPLSCLVGV